MLLDGFSIQTFDDEGLPIAAPAGLRSLASGSRFSAGAPERRASAPRHSIREVARVLRVERGADAVVAGERPPPFDLGPPAAQPHPRAVHLPREAPACKAEDENPFHSARP